MGYDSVPPPFNENYSFLQHDDSNTSTKPETLPETDKSLVLDQSVEIETVESNNFPLNSDKVSTSHKDTKTPLKFFFL